MSNIRIDELFVKRIDLKEEIEKYERWVKSAEDELAEVERELESLGAEF